MSGPWAKVSRNFGLTTDPVTGVTATDVQFLQFLDYGGHVYFKQQSRTIVVLSAGQGAAGT